MNSPDVLGPSGRGKIALTVGGVLLLAYLFAPKSLRW